MLSLLLFLIILVNSLYTITAEFDNLKLDSDKPVVMKNSSVSVEAERTIYKFDNLFNGNQPLGNKDKQSM